mmetsp:Transcript_17667/g.51421  ORF Transcript_17667/g.51421 Transcript_17667/m.51421 type:complete len:177 (-) Transcript_17667:30-560(-)
MPCPMCRARFDELFVPAIDREMQSRIAAETGRRYEERKAELERAGEWIAGNKRLVRFSYGNTHEKVENPKPSRSKKGARNGHQWCMFISLNNDPEETARYIKSVTYHLHPTFCPSKIKVTDAPFLLCRHGWGYFQVQMDIEFRESTGIGVHILEHMLSFEDNGHTESVILEIDGDT